MHGITGIGWVFPGWIGFSQWIKKEFGQYPTREMLLELARMGKEGRKEDTWYGMFSDIRKYGWKEVIKIQNEKWDKIIRANKFSKQWKDQKTSEGERQLRLWN